jgi:hypothetical protein
MLHIEIVSVEKKKNLGDSINIAALTHHTATFKIFQDVDYQVQAYGYSVACSIPSQPLK